MLRTLDSGPRGLTDVEADARLARFGESTLPARRTVSWPGRFLRSLRDPFTAVPLSGNVPAFARGAHPGSQAQSCLDRMHANWAKARKEVSAQP
ncbi:cation-transporting P-type ATPase [Streptomyces sp. NPDC058092]|uniref:cation-transporting P-type ATPase n=1 Tax=Streptomyces sp. NPDC058092 TaxID=3346336 RepID=UPI0036E61403